MVQSIIIDVVSKNNVFDKFNNQGPTSQHPPFFFSSFLIFFTLPLLSPYVIPVHLRSSLQTLSHLCLKPIENLVQPNTQKKPSTKTQHFPKKKMKYIQHWGELAPALLISLQKSSSCPKLEPIIEEGSENIEDVQKNRRHGCPNELKKKLRDASGDAHSKSQFKLDLE